MSWHTGRMVGFDLETTGVDLETDRIVTATIVEIDPNLPREVNTLVHDWLINPGIEIPAGASAVHGITTERAVEEGIEPGPAVADIASLLTTAWARGIPVIAYNGCFDFTILDREMRRHGHGPLVVGTVIDPLVIDKHVDRYRKGSRKLIDTCALLGIVLSEEDAHSSAADALAAARIAWKLAAKYPEIGGASLDDLQTMQAAWYAEQQTSLAAHFRKQADKAKDVDEQIKFMARATAITTDWPILPHASELQAGVA